MLAILIIELRESLRMTKLLFCLSSEYSRALRIAIASAVYMEHSTESLYVISSTSLYMIVIPTVLSVLDASV